MANNCHWLQNASVQLLLLFLLVSLTYFPNLGAEEPGLMEARNFISAREMAESGNWLVPALNGEVRLAKPPLPTWLTALAGLAADDMGNAAALRFPAAIMSSLMVLFLFFLGRQLTQDKLIPFLAAAVLASSFGLFNTGREGTWDIYCHSFMAGAIWLLVKGWRSIGPGYGAFALSGVLLACSFLSKGPVAFYAMLLPFLISYLFCFGRSAIHRKWRGLLLALSIGVLLGMAWPLYIFLVEPNALARNLLAESAAWINRHVKPLWYYWGFAAQTGAWTVFTVAALAVPRARRRVNQYLASRGFVFGWVVLSVLLLSVVPEKKERYLLPTLMPLALLTACYLRYLMETLTQGRGDKWGRWIMAGSTGAILLAAVAFPVAAFFLAYRAGIVSLAQQLGLTAASFMLAYAIFMAALRRNAAFYLLAVLLLNSFVLVLGFPLYDRVLHPAGNYKGLLRVREKNEFSNLPFYAVDGLPVVYIWQVGKQVDTLRIENQRLQLPAHLPAAVFSQTPLTQINLPDSSVSIQELESFRTGRNNPEEVYYAYVLSAIAKAR